MPAIDIRIEIRPYRRTFVPYKLEVLTPDAHRRASPHGIRCERVLETQWFEPDGRSGARDIVPVTVRRQLSAVDDDHRRRRS